MWTCMWCAREKPCAAPWICFLPPNEGVSVLRKTRGILGLPIPESSRPFWLQLHDRIEEADEYRGRRRVTAVPRKEEYASLKRVHTR